MVGVNPLDGTNYLDTVSAFIEGFLHLLAGEGVWRRGRHLSRFPRRAPRPSRRVDIGADTSSRIPLRI
jgi:hypothetical protein